MHIYSATLDLEALHRIADGLGIVLHNADDLGPITRGRRAGQRHLTTTLRPVIASDKYRAIGRDGRRVFAIDWHGHRDFMWRVFELDGEAEVDSALARYVGRDEFLALHGLTGSGLNGGLRAKVTAPVAPELTWGDVERFLVGS